VTHVAPRDDRPLGDGADAHVVPRRACAEGASACFRSPMRRAHRALALLLLAPGCGSVDNLRDGVAPFGGVRRDARLIERLIDVHPFALALVLDVPLSVVVDVATLPVVLVHHVVEARRAVPSGARWEAVVARNQERREVEDQAEAEARVEAELREYRATRRRRAERDRRHAMARADRQDR
jgi:uncharacterized protein YceK